jgi:hypothetical protein
LNSLKLYFISVFHSLERLQTEVSALTPGDTVAHVNCPADRLNNTHMGIFGRVDEFVGFGFSFVLFVLVYLEYLNIFFLSIFSLIFFFFGLLLRRQQHSLLR